MTKELSVERRRVENTLRSNAGMRELSEAEIANSILTSSHVDNRPEKPISRPGNPAGRILDIQWRAIQLLSPCKL
jgi:hypothetical protein